MLTDLIPGPTPKEDCEELLRFVRPLAERLLRECDGFLPFGATMAHSGEITSVSGATGDEFPAAEDVLALLNDAFRGAAIESRLRAAALAYDIRVRPPGKRDAQDAIAVNLDHRDGYSVVVVYPYVRHAAGDVSIEAPYAYAGTGADFGE